MIFYSLIFVPIYNQNREKRNYLAQEKGKKWRSLSDRKEK